MSDQDDTPKMKISFAPGCFDDFEGTQAELDHLVAMITERFSRVAMSTADAEATAEDWHQLPAHVQQHLIALFEDIETGPQAARTLH